MPSANVNYILELTVTIFLAAYLLPSAIGGMMVPSGYNVTGNSTGQGIWNPAIVTMWQILIPLLVIISVALLLMPQELSQKIGFKKR